MIASLFYTRQNLRNYGYTKRKKDFLSIRIFQINGGINNNGSFSKQYIQTIHKYKHFNNKNMSDMEK